MTKFIYALLIVTLFVPLKPLFAEALNTAAADADVDVKPLTKGIQFREGLSVFQYRMLIRSWLNNKYNNSFNDDSWGTKYFIKTLAQNAYSLNGYLDSDIFNEIVKGRSAYYKIDKEITGLNVHPDIKNALRKLYAAVCIYTRKNSNAIEASLIKIKNIPPDAVLYQIQAHNIDLYGDRDFGKGFKDKTNEHIKDDYILGNYVGTAHGENLYYICAGFYDNFMELSQEQQVKLLNDIYSYNPTLMIAPPIKRNYYLVGYIMNLIYPQKNPVLLKYALRGEVNWLMLPPKI